MHRLEDGDAGVVDELVDAAEAAPTTCATPACDLLGSRHVGMHARARRRGGRTRRRLRSSVSSSMSSSAMRWPRSRNHWPMARPMPRAPPVTTATGEWREGWTAHGLSPVECVDGEGSQVGRRAATLRA